MNPQTLFEVRGLTAVITGGTGGLGRLMAHALARAGMRVAVLSRRAEVCQKVAEDIRAEGGEALGLACDVLDRASLERAAGAITQVLGGVDALVNGAGGNNPQATTAPERPFFDLEAQVLEQVFDINLMGTLLSCQVFGHGMAAQGQGSIVNIASMSSVRPLTRVVAYSAAKAAVVNFTQWLAVHLAQEYSPRLRVNALAPGFFLTEQNRYLLTDAETGELTPRGKKIIEHTPMARLGAPEDLMGTLLWLVSPASAFLTGVVVPVDGGFSAYSGV